jgi:hypothetical protein
MNHERDVVAALAANAREVSPERAREDASATSSTNARTVPRAASASAAEASPRSARESVA